MMPIWLSTKIGRGHRSGSSAWGSSRLAALVCCMGGGAFAQELDCNVSPVGGSEEYEICNLGTLNGGTYIVTKGVSADGTAVVGRDGAIPFRWTEIGGMEGLGTLSGEPTIANGVNADGTVVVGTSGNRAFRWVKGVGISDIGTLAGGITFANAVNPDGTIVVGLSTVNNIQRAYRWTEGSGMQSLFEGDHSEAFGVNADGTVIVGEYYTGWRVAFRWVEGTGMQSLRTLDGGNNSRATAVNSDGSVVVGYSDMTGGSRRAFRWVEDGMAGDPGNPQMENLGTLEGGSYSTGNAVNADGSVVVGASNNDVGTWAFRWVEGVGMQNLGGLTGSTYSSANGVSADGAIVVGDSRIPSDDPSEYFGTTRSFIWRAASVEVPDEDTPPSGGTMEDCNRGKTSGKLRFAGHVVVASN